MHSKVKLFSVLASDGPRAFSDVVELGLDHPAVRNETYGRKSMVYLYLASYAERKEVESLLDDEGFKVSPRYAPGSAIVEVQVSYFKGSRWNV